MDFGKFFKLLGIGPGSSVEAIKKAYHDKAKETHPDKGGTTEKFQEVQHAYMMLTSPKYRYDSETKKERRRDQDLELRFNVAVPFEDAFFGRPLIMNYGRPNKSKNEAIEILRIEEPISPGSVATREFRRVGYGIKDGARTGDAIVTLHFEPSPKFQIKGIDVLYEQAVPLKILLAGGKVSVETMWGVEEIVVPPASQPGSVVVVPNKGVNRHGNQLVVLGLIYPKQKEFKEDSFWDTFDIDW